VATLPTSSVDGPLRLVIAYKLAHAASAFVLAILLVVAVVSGRATELMSLFDATRIHGMRAWIAMLVDHPRATSPNTLWLAAAGIVAADGALASLEAWALARGLWWGPWLIVLLTGAFVPGELIALSRHPSVTRAALLITNLAIAIFLAVRAHRSAARKLAS
jgi:uncharacterized membrane protein (DUF2068 family)